MPLKEHFKSSSQASPTRCDQCNPVRENTTKRNTNTRNLVVCIDGTSNQFGRNNTNVVKLFAKIDLESTKPEQYAYYSSGIGTRPKSLHIIDRMERAVTDKLDMAVAWNMEEIVKDAYAWLARMYREGDQIYLFGFSRGAYQVRVLAGMIHEVGLIKTPTEKQIGTAYDRYQAIQLGRPKTRQIAREFKNTFSWLDSGVHFVGVWDTVSSVGLIKGDVFLSTSSSASHACHFRHALALDERRVKFMPEYFHEMNSQKDIRQFECAASSTSAGQATTGNESTGSGKGADLTQGNVSSPSTGYTATSASEPRELTGTDEGADHTQSNVSSGHATFSSGQRDANDANSTGNNGKKNCDIKEVWFAGSHSDVGGKNRPGFSHQAGNASLLWMRREAAAKGLLLKPSDVVWVPDDIDFGTSDSMSWLWRVVECIPIRHQVSFSGVGENTRRTHKFQPRRMIPGQKVHASVLFANAYTPTATLGEGFDIPIVQFGRDDMKLDDQFWEMGLFDDTAAEELLRYLGIEEGVAPVHLDRLLFMLRFEEGKQSVRNISGWQEQFMNIIRNRNYTQLVRLVAMASYYEASREPKDSHRDELSKCLDEVKTCLSDILAVPKHRDVPRAFALLWPLTRHAALREAILKPAQDTLVKLLDSIVKDQADNFEQAMDGLNCLLQCENTREFFIDILGADPPKVFGCRLAWTLMVEDPRLLTAALRMALTLARIPNVPKAQTVCSLVKPTIMELASRDGLVGHLAVEISLALYDSNDKQQLNIHNKHVRANLANALIRLNYSKRDSAGGRGDSADPLRRMFGFNEPFSEEQQKRIRKLTKSAQKVNARERTAATMTLLKLCESQTIRNFLLDDHLMDVFIGQLRRKDTALLAAYALTTCLSLEDSTMRETILNNNDLPKNIVGMLRSDYFDDAVGTVEGFQIFEKFMQHAELRDKIQKYEIPGILGAKLGKGKPKETRTSLICLKIFKSSGRVEHLTPELFKKSLEYLQNPTWKVQKTGVAILSALARSEHGVAAIDLHIREIVGMLLPKDHVPDQATLASPIASSEGQTQSAPTTSKSIGPSPLSSPNTSLKPPSQMMGPAYALRILAQNRTLRDHTRRTVEYRTLKHLFLSGALVGKDTSAWQVHIPNRTDVVTMLDKMIKAVDGELSEEGLIPIGDAMLPRIRHWNRLTILLGKGVAAGVGILPALSVVAVVVPPIYLSSRVYGFVKRQLSLYQHFRVLRSLNERDGAPGGEDQDPLGEHGGESFQAVQTAQTLSAGSEKQPRRTKDVGATADVIVKY